MTLVASAVSLPERLSPTDLRAGSGTMMGLVGPNGGGKTSLLRALAAVDGTSGTVEIDGETLRGLGPARRERLVGYVAASRHLAWPIRVRDLIGLGVTSIDPRRIDALIATLELEPLLDRASNSLSTGERARVMLARALAPSPALLLLDEPLANLDPYWTLVILDLLAAEARAHGRTVIMALHGLDRLAAFDRALLIDGGRVTLDAPPANLLRSGEFEHAFRIRMGRDGPSITLPADRQSSP